MAETKTFRELAAEQLANTDASKPIEAPVEAGNTQPPTDVATDLQATATGGPGEARTEPTESGTAPDATPVSQPKSFTDYLKDNGYEIEGLDTEELYAQVVDNLGFANKARQEIADLRQQLASVESKQSAAQLADGLRASAQSIPNQTPSPVSVSAQAPSSPAVQRSLAPLKSPDPTLYQMVQREGDTGAFIPKQGMGDAGMQAAREINAYHSEKNRRAEQILSDPFELMGGDLRAMIQAEAKAIAESQLQAWQKSQQDELSRQQKTFQEQESSRRLDAFYEANKAKLFLLDQVTGQPRKVLNSDSPAMTAAGHKFQQEYAKLQQRFPGADVISLMETALDMAAPVQAQAPPIVKTAEEKKRDFAATNRVHQSPESIQGTRVATPEIQSAVLRRPRSFKDIVRASPEYAQLVASGNVQ